MPNTYLLTWNPKRWVWDSLAEDARQSAAGDLVNKRWSSGNTTRITAGDRVFLIRLGAEPRGIVASGWACGEPRPDTHWDAERAERDETALFVEAEYECVLDPETQPPLPHSELLRRLPEFNWSPQASGHQVPAAVARVLEEMWLSHVGGPVAPNDPEVAAYEGEVRLLVVRHRRREQRLRSEKIQHALQTRGRLVCEVPGCGFDFEEVYGPGARGFAHVHHLEPLHSQDTPRLTRLADLAIVCANCHAFIHLGGKCRPLAGLLAHAAEIEA